MATDDLREIERNITEHEDLLHRLERELIPDDEILQREVEEVREALAYWERHTKLSCMLDGSPGQVIPLGDSAR